MGTTSGIPFIAGRGANAAAQSGSGRRDVDATQFGELAPLVARPDVTDVFVHDGAVWVDAGAGPRRDATATLAEPRVRALAGRLIGLGGRHLDEATPCVDVALEGGIRVHAILPPITPGTELSIRLPGADRIDLDVLERGGAFRRVSRCLVEELVARRSNVLITGAGGSGKTTLLAAMLSLAPDRERIVVIEDVAELQIGHPHVVRMQTRQANIEGAGEVTLERLVRESLRMRPDRLVLGECRGAEIRELLAALNTGHDGGAGTLHANSLADVPARLEALGALAGMSTEALARQAVSAIGAVLHVVRSDTGRFIERVGRLALDGSALVVRDATSED